jgi:DNA-binding response OmpR family regulator
MRLLLVENHATFAATVSAAFLAEHEVVVVGSVLNALDLVRQDAFDAALVDFDLDDTKGDVFVRRVRRMGRALPIVAISARDDGNQALLTAGANAICSKADFRRIADALGLATERAATATAQHDVGANATGEATPVQVAVRIVDAGSTGQDRALSIACRTGTLVVLADGAGGTAGGPEAAQAVIDHISALRDDLSPDFVAVLSRVW